MNIFKKLLAATSKKVVNETKAEIKSVLPKKAKKPTRSFVEFFSFLKDEFQFQPEYCFDVGAARGTPSIYKAFDKSRHLVFEPLEVFHDELAKNMEPYKHTIYKCGVMEKEGTMAITKNVSNIYGSSFMGLNGDTVVDVTTIDKIVSDESISGPCLLKTDCQGGDLSVIKGAEKSLDIFEVIIMESSFYRFWGEHHPDFFDIVTYLHERDFVVFDILDGLFKPSNNALGQVDLVFVKKNGMFRPHSKW